MPRPSRVLPIAALALAVAAPAADAAWPGVNGRISLTQRVPAAGGVRANRDVFAYARDTTRTRVTTSTDNEEQSSWSPDGLWIAYKRREAVFVAPWDGSVRPRELTRPNDDPVNNTQPAGARTAGGSSSAPTATSPPGATWPTSGRWTSRWASRARGRSSCVAFVYRAAL